MSSGAVIGPIDRASMWITVGGETLVAEVEEVLRRTGLSLGSQPPSVYLQRVREWLEGPLAGRRVEGGRLASAVAGVEVLLRGGLPLQTRATPRSAAGPGLAQLFLGSGGRYGLIRVATLRAQPWQEQSETLDFQGAPDTAARWLLTVSQSIAPPLEASWLGGPTGTLSLRFATGSELDRLHLGEAAAAARALGLEPAPPLSPWEPEAPVERELARREWGAALEATAQGQRLGLCRLARESAVFFCPPSEADTLPPGPERDPLLAELEERLAQSLSG